MTGTTKYVTHELDLKIRNLQTYYQLAFGEKMSWLKLLGIMIHNQEEIVRRQAEDLEASYEYLSSPTSRSKHPSANKDSHSTE